MSSDATIIVYETYSLMRIVKSIGVPPYIKSNGTTSVLYGSALLFQ